MYVGLVKEDNFCICVKFSVAPCQGIGGHITQKIRTIVQFNVSYGILIWNAFLHINLQYNVPFFYSNNLNIDTLAIFSQ